MLSNPNPLSDFIPIFFLRDIHNYLGLGLVWVGSVYLLVAGFYTLPVDDFVTIRPNKLNY